MDRWKSSGGSQRKEDQRREKSQRKEDAGARKGSRKVPIHRVFPMICGSGRSKSRLAKAVAEPSGQMRD